MLGKRTFLLFSLGLLPVVLGQAETAALLGHPIASAFDSNKRTSKPIISVPFTFEKNVPIVKVNVNGNKDEYFLVDSGAARTLLNADEVSRLKVTVSSSNLGPMPGSGDSTGQAIVAARSVALQLDNILILRGDIPAISLSQLSKELGVRITGIIGYDILRAHPTIIDFIHRRFLIYEGKEFTPSAGETLTEFNVENNSPLPIISG